MVIHFVIWKLPSSSIILLSNWHSWWNITQRSVAILTWAVKKRTNRALNIIRLLSPAETKLQSEFQKSRWVQMSRWVGRFKSGSESYWEQKKAQEWEPSWRRTLYSPALLLSLWRQTGRNVSREERSFIVRFGQRGHHKYTDWCHPWQVDSFGKKNWQVFSLFGTVAFVLLITYNPILDVY